MLHVEVASVFCFHCLSVLRILQDTVLSNNQHCHTEVTEDVPPSCTRYSP